MKESVPRYEQRLLYYLCETLEDLGDRIKAMGTKFSLQKSGNKKTAALLTLLEEQFELSYQYFYKPSIETANNSLHKSKFLKEQFEEHLASNVSKEERSALVLFWSASTIISHIVTMRLDHIQDAR